MRREPGGESPETSRKILKPQVEKRRRERINSSLEKLRVLLSQAMTSEKLKNPKIEKAEILEHTVEFLQSRMMPSEVQEEHSQNFQSGFQRCLQTTVHLINSNLQLSQVSRDLLFQQLSSSNLLEASSTTVRDSVHLCKTFPPIFYQTSRWTSRPSNTTVDHTHHVGNGQRECNSDQTAKSWRPWV
ncbi:transcription factor HES-7.1-like [Pseudophryne corroboree]|uniref:transcription factor HES-7.1-like n=1 Tax=Pseudophryne corroboree TaxID=495146 RepID=UPI00308177F9